MKTIRVTLTLVKEFPESQVQAWFKSLSTDPDLPEAELCEKLQKRYQEEIHPVEAVEEDDWRGVKVEVVNV